MSGTNGQVDGLASIVREMYTLEPVGKKIGSQVDITTLAQHALNLPSPPRVCSVRCPREKDGQAACR